MHQPKKINGLVIKKINKNGQSKIIEHLKDIPSTSAVDGTEISGKSKRIKKRNFSCKQCESSFFKRRELRVCSLRSELATISLYHLQDHVKEAHTTEDKNRCPICRGLYNDKEVLEKHIPLHEGKHRLQCVECNTVFTRSNGLMRHMSIHTGEKVSCEM